MIEGDAVDRVTDSFLTEFVAAHNLEKLDRSKQFEAFAAYCVVSSEYDEEFDPSELRTGDGADLGIDAAALIVNGDIVQDVEEIGDLKSRNNYLQGRIILVQAKTSSEFSGNVVSDLVDNLIDFFSESPTLPVNEDVQHFRDLVNELYSNSASFRRGLPELVIRYVSTGTWQEEPHLVAKVDAARKRLEGVNLFESVDLECLGAKEIQKLYRDAESSVEASFEFPDTIVLPDIEGIEQAHLGIVDATEYLKLITDAAGNIRRSLFYDNVRDFQDYNEVNRGIRETIRNQEVRGQFVVLNNGVTIVAREARTTRNTFTLRDYQIVNGCQTSHVLFDERDAIGEKLYLSLKVIVTRNETVASSITAATNKQTEVSDEDLQALEALQKNLEDYFAAHNADKRLYYERRSKQYANAGSQVEKTRIVTRPQLVKAYAAMFLDEPWRAGRYYKQLQRIRSDDIFAQSDLPFPYYVSAVALYRLDYFFRNQYVDVRYKPARYQMLMGVRHLLAGAESPPSSKRKLEKYCDQIADTLWDQTEGPAAFQKLLPVVDSAVEATEPGGVLDRDTVRTQTFTDRIAQGVAELRS